MSGLRSIGDVLGGVGSLSGLLGGAAGAAGGGAAGAAGAAGGLAGLGFGPLAALTAIPAGIQLLGNAFGASSQRKARAEALKEQRRATKTQIGLNLFAPEADLARQGFGETFNYQLAATSPFATREKARDLSDIIFLQEEPAKAGYMSSLAGRYRGVV